jgi:hypothetical protein
MAQERQARPAGTSPATPRTSTAPVHMTHRSGVGGTTNIADSVVRRSEEETS